MDLRAIAPMSAVSAGDTRSNSGFTHLLPSDPGSLVLFGEGVMSSNPEPGVQRPELPAYRITTAGEELARFGAFPGMEVVQPDGFPLPFGARTHTTTSDGALVVGTANTTEFRIFAPSGALVRIVRWPDHDRTLGGPFLSKWSDMVEEDQFGMREVVETLPRPERFPAYSDLVGTEAGEVLIGDYTGPLGIWPLRRADDGPEWAMPQFRIPARRWLVFDSDGALAASVTTLEGFEPYAVRAPGLGSVYRRGRCGIDSRVRADQTVRHAGYRSVPRPIEGP